MRRIAVIGGGISGLTAGYVLSHTDYVTLFEADDRLGGHADTHLVVPAAGPPMPVDTGFIVCNERTYPLLTRLFAELGVSTRPSEMSMSVQCGGCGLQYAGQRGLAGLAAGLSRGRGRYLRLLADVPRFHRAARRHLAATGSAASPADLTFGEFLDQGGYSAYFQAHFALPLVAAVWSCPPGTALGYPAEYLFRFLANHGMLAISGSPPWRTVVGGSRSYVEQVAKRLQAVRLCAPVRAVHRQAGRVEVHDASGEALTFDAVVIATHPDQALRLLARPTAAEQDVLGAFRYTPNPALLHTDARLLPTRRAARASWNYELSHCRAGQVSLEAPRISYHMNRLQSLSAAEDYIVTLGGEDVVDPDRVIDRMDYSHPAYTPASVAAQRRLPELNTGVTAFAGAYHGWGFHEDGCRSGAEAARSLGGTW
ncbi:MAG: FAD-dependent oxidoreductase [Actinomycetota bacterium]|nr:FAD-dependent oxidoreductase [Actinomycetota bacterium]